MVGESAVCPIDIALRLAMSETAGDGAGPPERAAVELLREVLEAEVARGAGAGPTAAEVEALDRHAASTSRAPEVLARLRTLLGEAGFARHVLLPRATALRLRDHFAGGQRTEGETYDGWFRRRAEVVAIRLEPGLASSVCATHGGVWWLVGPCRRAGDGRATALPRRPRARRQAPR
jgi:hypothetical protein